MGGVTILFHCNTPLHNQSTSSENKNNLIAFTKINLFFLLDQVLLRSRVRVVYIFSSDLKPGHEIESDQGEGLTFVMEFFHIHPVTLLDSSASAQTELLQLDYFFCKQNITIFPSYLYFFYFLIITWSDQTISST